MLFNDYTSVIKKITSPHNEEIKAVRRLHQTKERKKTGLFLAEGLRTITTLMTGSCTLSALYITDTLAEKDISLGKQFPQKTRLVTDDVMHKISNTTTPSGILAVFHQPIQPELSQIGPGLVLTHIADPGNMGTLIRTAAAMNCSSVICIEGADPWSPKVVQATAGTICSLSIFTLTWQELRQHTDNLPCYALVTPEDPKAKKLDQVTTSTCLIIVGNEATGIPHAYLNDCHQRITIPMPGKAESLNAAVAGSIAAYSIFGHQS